MSFSLRSTSAGPDAYPAGRPEAGELVAFGLRALDAIGVRLAEIFLVTTLLGVVLASIVQGF